MSALLVFAEVNMLWLGFGAGSLAYGLRGERLPGKVISIRDTGHNTLSGAERAFWIACGVGEVTVGILQLLARYRSA
jgi:hypothetical protein